MLKTHLSTLLSQPVPGESRRGARLDTKHLHKGGAKHTSCRPDLAGSGSEAVELANLCKKNVEEARALMSSIFTRVSSRALRRMHAGRTRKRSARPSAHSICARRKRRRRANWSPASFCRRVGIFQCSRHVGPSAVLTTRPACASRMWWHRAPPCQHLCGGEWKTLPEMHAEQLSCQGHLCTVAAEQVCAPMLFGVFRLS